MTDQDAGASAPTEPADMPPVMQLRILSGCHEGASLPIAAGEFLRVGADEDCDVLLSDCGLAAGASLLLSWQQGRWQALPADEPGAAQAPGFALGEVALLGEVGATICASQLPWTPWTSSLVAEAATPPASDAPADEAPPPEVAAAPLEAPTRAAARPRLHPLAAVTALVLVILGAGWALWNHAPASAQADAPSEKPASLQLSPAAQDKAVKSASLAIALADPALRMQVEPNAEGGVTVSGWVDNAEQFDRLAQALSSLRPLPRLAVRTAQEVLDALSDIGTAQGLHLQFALMGAGKVQVKGVVLAPAVQQQVLAQLKERAPQGIEIIDGLRVASLQGPAVLRWLGAQGLTATRADWDGEQLVLAVAVRPTQRTQLERLLASAQTPLSDVPFLLQTSMLKEAAAERRPGIAEAGLPFRIRSVVGGEAPYVVLADGVKLQPGGGHAGWRLAAIAPDHLVFDGPKRLEVSR